MDLNSKVEKSYALIKGFARRFGKPWVMFSGGKDSAALLLLAVEALGEGGVRGVVFTEVTGNSARCNIDYVYQVVDRLGLRDRFVHTKREDMDFFDAMVRWGVPGRTARWCWNEFKVRVWASLRPPVFLAGVKRSDSRFRALAGWDGVRRIHGMFVFSPIHGWSTEDVLAYLRSRNVPLSPCYRIYGHSGNCMYCPFRTRDEIAKTLPDPYWGSKILPALAKLRNERGRREYRRWLRYLPSKPLTTYIQGGGE